MSTWDHNAYKHWRKGTIVGSTPKNETHQETTVRVEVAKDKPDEWLEAWVENMSGNIQSVVMKRSSAWGFDLEQGEEDGFLKSFKAVGFQDGAKAVAPPKETASGDLLTLKSCSPNCHFIYFPSMYTGRLIGKKGQNIESIQAITKVSNFKMSSGMAEVNGSYSVAQLILSEFRKLLKETHAKKKTSHDTPMHAPSKSSFPLSSFPLLPSTKQTIGITTQINIKPTNVYKSLEVIDVEERDEIKQTSTEASIQEKEEAAYDLKVQAGCAWVLHRLKTTEMIHPSTSTKQNTKASYSPFARFSQDLLLNILDFIDSPKVAIATCAALASTNKTVAYQFLACHHRVWKKLAARSWPQLGQLRTKQPLLYPLACAMYQNRIITRNRIIQGNSLTTSKSFSPSSIELRSQVFHSLDFNAVCSQSLNQVYALALEYTLNPRTGSCDALQVNQVLVFRSLAELQRVSAAGEVSRSSPNPVLLVPCYRGAKQWHDLKEFTTRQLYSLGSMKRRHLKLSKDDHLLAPLQPVLVALKTYMVNASNGAPLDMDSFVALWRLLLALTDPLDREGGVRRNLVVSQLKAFEKGVFTPPDLGNFIPCILIMDPQRWSKPLKVYLNRAMPKNVMWICRDLCLAKKENLITLFKSESACRQAKDSETTQFLNTCFKTGEVSRKTVLFWIGLQRAVSLSTFLGSSSAVERGRAELVHGFTATPSLKYQFQHYISSMNNIDSWEKLFSVLADSNISAQPAAAAAAVATRRVRNATVDTAELLSIFRNSWKEGLSKGYFKEDMDFGKIHSNGGSNLFLIGNSFNKAAFMLDRSGSMSSPLVHASHSCYHHQKNKAPLTRFSAMTHHLLNLLELKPVSFSFSLQLFDHNLYAFKNGQLVQNTPNIRRDVKSFLASHGPHGGTNMAQAIQGLLDVPSVTEECFLLTDADIYGSSGDLVALASASTIPMHTIGVDLSPQGNTLMQNIAKAANGECSVVESKTLLESTVGKAA